jgi:hypothetical protein
VALIDSDEFIKLNPLDDFTNFIMDHLNTTWLQDNHTLAHTVPFLVQERNETVWDRITARKQLRQRMGLETTVTPLANNTTTGTGKADEPRRQEAQNASSLVLTVLSVLEQYSLKHGTLPCHAMSRRRYSAVVDKFPTLAKTLCRPALDPSIASYVSFNMSRLSTIQFLYFDPVEEWTKVLIDLRRIPSWSTTLSEIEQRQNPHRPLHNYCPGRLLMSMASLIEINHYVNFWHVYDGRRKQQREQRDGNNNTNNNNNNSSVARHRQWSQSAHHRYSVKCDQMHEWLNQFVQHFGMTKAMYLLSLESSSL